MVKESSALLPDVFLLHWAILVYSVCGLAKRMWCFCIVRCRWCDGIHVATSMNASLLIPARYAVCYLMTEPAVVTFTVLLLDTSLLCVLFVAKIAVFALHIIFLCRRRRCCNAYGNRPLTTEVLIGQTLLLLNNALKPSLPETERVHSYSW